MKLHERNCSERNISYFSLVPGSLLITVASFSLLASVTCILLTFLTWYLLLKLPMDLNYKQPTTNYLTSIQPQYYKHCHDHYHCYCSTRHEFEIKLGCTGMTWALPGTSYGTFLGDTSPVIPSFSEGSMRLSIIFHECHEF